MLPNMSKRVGVWVSLCLCNKSEGRLAIDVRNRQSLSWTVRDASGRRIEGEATAGPAVRDPDWRVMNPGQGLTLSLARPQESRDGVLDLATVRWKLPPGTYTLEGVLEVVSPDAPANLDARPWTGRLPFGPFRFRVWADPSDDEIHLKVRQAREAHRGDPDATWRALTKIIQPGFTFRQVKMVLPPQPGWRRLYPDFVKYRLDDFYWVEADEVQTSERDEDDWLFTRPPEVRWGAPEPVLDWLRLAVPWGLEERLAAVVSLDRAHPRLPPPTIGVQVMAGDEALPVYEAYTRLGEAETRAGAAEAVAELAREKAYWCLATGLCHWNKDVQVRCARALAGLENVRLARYLVAVAEANAMPVRGDEAEAHAALQHALAAALNHALGTTVALKAGQDPAGLKAGAEVWRNALRRHTRTDCDPLVNVLFDWPAVPVRGVWQHINSPYFQALDALARQQGLSPGDYLGGSTGRAQILRVQGEDLVLAVMGNTPMCWPGTEIRKFVLLEKAGMILDTVDCRINSRYGQLNEEVLDAPAPDGARMIVGFQGGWHNYHEITYAGKSYTFLEDERHQDPEWDRQGLCRIGVQNRWLRVLFPTLWPKPEGSGLAIHLVEHRPGSRRGSLCEGAEKYTRLFAERGPDFVDAWMPGELRWFRLACPAPPEAVTAKHDGRDYLLVSNVPWYTMKPHSSGPRGKAWGLQRVDVTRDSLGRPALRLQFDADGARLFQTFWKDYGNCDAAFVVDGKVVAAGRLGDLDPEKLLLGAFSAEEEAAKLAESLRRGMVE
jgi:hypothetical protein